MNKFFHDLLAMLAPNLTDQNGSRRKVYAVYLAGSFARHLATPDSDLDLTLIVKPSKYDYLTNAKFDKQIIFEKDEANKSFFESLPEKLKLTATVLDNYGYAPTLKEADSIRLTELDIRIVSAPSFYKQLMNMSPNAADLLLGKVLYLNVKRKQSLFCAALPSQSNLVAQLSHLNRTDKASLNLPKYLAALIGITSHAIKLIEKDPLKHLKLADTVNYFANLTTDLLKALYPALNTPVFHSRHLTFPSYYHVMVSQLRSSVIVTTPERAKKIHDMAEATLADLTELSLRDLREELAFFKEAQSFVKRDSELVRRQAKAQNKLTNIFLNAM